VAFGVEVFVVIALPPPPEPPLPPPPQPAIAKISDVIIDRLIKCVCFDIYVLLFACFLSL
jgi:hypothetical protein